MTIYDVIEQAKRLKYNIKMLQNEIDNPAMVISVVSSLDFFIENADNEHNEESE